jgi:hypothetical protein
MALASKPAVLVNSGTSDISHLAATKQNVYNQQVSHRRATELLHNLYTAHGVTASTTINSAPTPQGDISS